MFIGLKEFFFNDYILNTYFKDIKLKVINEAIKLKIIGCNYFIKLKPTKSDKHCRLIFVIFTYYK